MIPVVDRPGRRWGVRAVQAPQAPFAVHDPLDKLFSAGAGKIAAGAASGGGARVRRVFSPPRPNSQCAAIAPRRRRPRPPRLLPPPAGAAAGALHRALGRAASYLRSTPSASIDLLLCGMFGVRCVLFPVLHTHPRTARRLSAGQCSSAARAPPRLRARTCPDQNASVCGKLSLGEFSTRRNPLRRRARRPPRALGRRQRWRIRVS